MNTHNVTHRSGVEPYSALMDAELQLCRGLGFRTAINKRVHVSQESPGLTRSAWTLQLCYSTQSKTSLKVEVVLKDKQKASNGPVR